MYNRVKVGAELAAIRHSGKLLAQVLAVLAKRTVPGITTIELDRLAADELKRLGGEPAFLSYQGFPNVLCVSVNDQIVHGIPGSYVIKDGDLVGLDFGVSYEGMITDGAVTVGVGKVSAEANRLLVATEDALASGIAQVKHGARIGDISAAIESRLRQDSLGVVEDLMGHGVGHYLHEEPGIPNFGRSGTGMELVAGMTIALEPMATLGSKKVKVEADDWTISTADGSLAAQFEHSVLVTEDGAEVLTQV